MKLDRIRSHAHTYESEIAPQNLEYTSSSLKPKAKCPHICTHGMENEFSLALCSGNGKLGTSYCVIHVWCLSQYLMIHNKLSFIHRVALTISGLLFLSIWHATATLFDFHICCFRYYNFHRISLTIEWSDLPWFKVFRIFSLCFPPRNLITWLRMSINSNGAGPARCPQRKREGSKARIIPLKFLGTSCALVASWQRVITIFYQFYNRSAHKKALL